MPGWLTAFACTLALEAPVYVAGLRRRVSAPRALLLAVALNVATHPLAWWLTAGHSWSRLAVVELGVWASEALLLWALARPLPLAEAVALALTANGLSAGVGLLLA